jgi:uncharacterized membrane protein
MRKSKYILYFAIFSVLTLILFVKIIRDFDRPLLSLIFGLICFSSLIVSGIVFFAHFTVEKTFLLFYLFFGALYLFVLPMTAVPDEVAHWLRIFEISEGHLLSDKDENSLGGRTMPEGLALSLNPAAAKYDDMFKNYSLTISKDARQWYNFSNTALYMPITYIFQIPGVLIGKILTTRTILVMYAGRICAFLLSLLFLFWALKYIPCCKPLLFTIALMPMFIHQAVSLSADAMLNTISLCSMAFILWSCSAQNELFKKKHILLICAFSLCLALSKIIYLPLVLLFCLISASKLRNKLFHKIFLAALLFVSFAASVLWFLYITKNYRYAWLVHADSAKQITNILLHPINYILLVIKTYFYGLEGFIATCIGSDLGWLNIHIGYKALVLYAMCLAAAFFCNDDLSIIDKRKNKRIHTVIYGLISAAIIILIATSEYVTWNAPYAKSIAGIQGRYFIPIVFPLALFVILLAKNIPVTFKIKYRGKPLSLKKENIFRLSLPVLSFVHLLVIKQILLFCK